MIVDSNVFIDVLNPEDEQSESVSAAFLQLAAERPPFLNHVIFAEISSSFSTVEGLQLALKTLGAKLAGFSDEDAFRAGRAFISYRRNGGPRKTILPDFLIGAQAAVRGWPILTRDPKRFSSYFSEVELIDPLALGV